MHESAAERAMHRKLGGNVHRGLVACSAVFAHVRSDPGEQEAQTVEQFAHRAERERTPGTDGR